MNPRADECDILVLRRLGHSFADGQADGWTSLGFDVGQNKSESSLYSVVLNAVTCGSHPELRRYGIELNENLLAPDARAASEIVSVHATLACTHGDVEHLEVVEPIEILALCSRSVEAVVP